MPASRLICTSLAVLAIGGGSLAAVSAAAADCGGADSLPNDVSVSDYATSLICIVNEQRREWGRPPLTVQRNLRRAAAWHASDMVAGRYFSHVEQDGTTLADRLVRANFIPRSGRWRAAENLAAGSGRLGTPAAIATAWMKSRPHRLNMLDPAYTMVGIGVAHGWPGPNGQNNSVTVDMDLGWRAASRRGSG